MIEWFKFITRKWDPADIKGLNLWHDSSTFDAMNDRIYDSLGYKQTWKNKVDELPWGWRWINALRRLYWRFKK